MVVLCYKVNPTRETFYYISYKINNDSLFGYYGACT